MAKNKLNKLEEKQIRDMFSSIAGRYDLLNHILSFGIDLYWWRHMARASGATPGRRFLDVAAGTGDSSLALAKRGAEVISTDFTSTMLKLGINKIQHQDQDRLILASVEADAQYLPFKSNTFDGVTICYGIRNVKDRHKAYLEFLRVLKPKGILTILEFSKTKHQWLEAIYRTYIRHILPMVGGFISGVPEAYTYLYESIRSFPDQPTLAKELSDAGFTNVNWKNLTCGIVALHTAEKPDYQLDGIIAAE
jgi:demethylmenaquinone methyltransferase/2-methoxy-6-polyprenyl-1,4-benzoquinol methylase